MLGSGGTGDCCRHRQQVAGLDVGAARDGVLRGGQQSGAGCRMGIYPAALMGSIPRSW